MEQGRDRILVSPFPQVTLPEGGLYQFIHGKLLEFGPRTALIDSTTGDQLTYQEVLNMVERASFYLQRLGVKKGNVFALCAPNSVTYAVLLLAVARLGAVFAPVNSLSTLNDLKHSLSVAEAKYLFTTQVMAEQVRRIMASTTVKMLFVEGSQSANSLFEPIPEGHTAQPLIPMHSEDTCGIMFSSGTSGLPKAVESTQRGFLAQALISRAIGMGTSRGVIFQPMAHVMGICLLLCSLASGAFKVIMPRFDLETFCLLLEKYRIQQIAVVPPILVLLAKSPLLDKYDLRCVEEIIAGAAPISAELEHAVLKRFGGRIKQIRQVYGMTENNCPTTSTPVLSKQAHSAPPGSAGLVNVNMQLKVSDLTTGEDLGPNQTGEIRVKSKFNMIRYKGNPQATREIFDSNGFLRSGDIGYYDEHGYILVVDRLKELIKYNAYQVAPAELEGVLLAHPDVADAGVIGIPDTQAGELPHAWVVRKPGSSVTEENICNFVAEKVAPYKKLRGGVRFVAEIPKTASGKILHRVMREEIKKLKSQL